MTGICWKLKECNHQWFPMYGYCHRVHNLFGLTTCLQTKHPNFDPSHELEEILLEDNPLRAKRRTKEVDKMSPEMKKMEEQ